MKIYYIRYKTIYFLLVFIIILLFLYYFCLKNSSVETFNNKDNLYYEGNGDNNSVAFSCNVDWGEEHIPQMLELFKEKNIKITFFVTGKWAEKNLVLLKKMYESGHEIGSHGYMHKDYGDLNYDENLEEIKKADTIIAEIIGKKPFLFAPPSGSFNEETLKAAEKENHKTIMWSVDTIDWREDSTKEVIIERVMKKVKKNSIILMHPKSETLKSLPIIIDKLKKQKLSIEKVSNILN